MLLSGLDVVVVGGGVAGLGAAAALVQRGANVTLLEQAGGFLEVGAGLQISPNGARVIAALGQGEGLAQTALRSRAVVLRDGQGAREVLRLSLPENGPGFHLIHRADLIALLERAAVGVKTRFVAQVTRIAPEGPRPSVTLAGGERIDADLVLGADGLHSVLRKTLNPTAAHAPFFTGQVAWRALIPCAPDAPREAEVFMGPGRHLVSYPLRGGRLRNIVAVEERRAWAQEGWNHPDNPAHLRRAFAGFGGPVPGWLAQVDKVWLWGLFRHPVAPCWQAGHAAILGDAAHPTLPFMAQGANMALEDAFSLVRNLEQAANIPEGLARYQMARHTRVARVVAAATKNARNYHLRAPLAQIAHLALRLSGRIAPNAPLRQFGWIYDHDVTET
jgi:salicylate hydroxylase